MSAKLAKKKYRILLTIALYFETIATFGTLPVVMLLLGYKEEMKESYRGIWYDLDC